MNLKAEIENILEDVVDVCPEDCSHPVCENTKKSATTRLLKLFHEEAMEILADEPQRSEHILDPAIVYRNQLRHELRTKITETMK